MAVKLSDVANEAGVSTSTASRVIRGTKYISDQTKSKVLDAFEKLNYKPNHLARGLKYGRTYTIGFIIHDITNPFFSHAVKGVEEYLRTVQKNSMELILYNTSGDPLREVKALELMIDKRVEGLILASTCCGDCISLAEKIVKNHHIPIVSIDNNLGGFELGIVSINNHKGAYVLTSHLIEHGYSDIGFIAGSLDETHARDRQEGYRQALFDHGLDTHLEYITSSNWSVEDGFKKTQDWIKSGKLPEAIVCSNNFICIGVLMALKENGISVPKDIAIVSNDDIEFGSLFEPGLTTLDYSWTKIGEEAVRLLIDKKKRAKPINIQIPFEIVIRQSCGCNIK